MKINWFGSNRYWQRAVIAWSDCQSSYKMSFFSFSVLTIGAPNQQKNISFPKVSLILWLSQLKCQFSNSLNITQNAPASTIPTIFFRGRTPGPPFSLTTSYLLPPALIIHYRSKIRYRPQFFCLLPQSTLFISGGLCKSTSWLTWPARRSVVTSASRSPARGYRGCGVPGRLHNYINSDGTIGYGA